MALVGDDAVVSGDAGGSHGALESNVTRTWCSMIWSCAAWLARRMKKNEEDASSARKRAVVNGF